MCSVLWILYSKIPIRQQIRHQNHGGLLRLNFPQRNKGNYLWKTELLRWLRWLRICLQCRRPGFDPWIGKIPWRRKLQPTPAFLPGEFHEQRNLAGYSPWGRRESDTTKRSTLYRKEAVDMDVVWGIFFNRSYYFDLNTSECFILIQCLLAPDIMLITIIGVPFIHKHCKLHVDIHLTDEDIGP